jgi:hypothetical protein
MADNHDSDTKLNLTLLAFRGWQRCSHVCRRWSEVLASEMSSEAGYGLVHEKCRSPEFRQLMWL